MKNKLTRFQLIEIPVPANGLGIGQRLFIPDQPQLRTQTNQIIIIQALEAYDNITNPSTPSGADTVTVANLGVSYLVLNVFGTETMQYIPFTDLINIQTTDTSVQRAFTNIPKALNNITKVDWTKSFIQVGDTVAAGVSYMIGVEYISLPDDNNTIISPQEFPIIS